MAKGQSHTRARAAGHQPRAHTFAAVRLLVAGFVVVVVVAVVFWWARSHEGRADSQPALALLTPTKYETAALSDDELQRAADTLLAATNPDLPENAHFTEFARDTLRWMAREHASGRLRVAFVSDTASAGIPATVMMAATRLEDRPTIIIANRPFAEFLIQGGRQSAPFSQRQRNDFTIALVHETFHLQKWDGEPTSDEQRTLGETGAWRAVNLGLVRPWRASNQPLDPRFLQVDDGFRSCADQLPCPAVARMVRVTR